MYCLLLLCMFMPMCISYIKGGLYRNKEIKKAVLSDEMYVLLFSFVIEKL